MRDQGTLRWSVTLVTLAVLSGWLASLLTPRQNQPDTARSAGRIDYYSRDVTRTVLDESGNPRQTLKASMLHHYPEDDHTELMEPALTLYQAHQTPWVIQAETAVLPAGGEIIYLNGAVHISRAADAEGRKLEILTRNVRLKPDQDYAETSEYIELSSPPDRLSGKGAEVHFGDDVKIRLLSEVRRKHDAKKTANP